MSEKAALKCLCILMAVILSVPAAMAQGDDRPGADRPKYDPATEIQFTATVKKVQEGTCGGGRRGVHLFVESEDKDLAVHVGPGWFLEEKKFPVAVGDTLTIIGSRVSCQGVQVIQPREMVKDGKTIVLRDEKGLPLWAGQGKGRGKGPATRPSRQD